MKSDAKGGTWRMVFAMALSGTIGLLVTESGQAPMTVVFFRCLIGGAGLLALLAVQRKWVAMDRASFAWLILGALALVTNWICLFSAYAHSSISAATVAYHTQPFMLLLLVAVAQRERIEPSKLAWMVVAFGGVILITSAKGGGDRGGSMWLGVALACSAAFMYAVATFAAQRLRHLPAAQVAALQMSIGVVVLAPLALPLTAPFSTKGIASVATLGLVHTAFLYTLLYAAFQRLTSQSVAALAFIYPVITVLVDVGYYDMAISAAQAVGMSLILFAVVANQRSWRVFRLRPAGARA